jgi:hypothetical protein
MIRINMIKAYRVLGFVYKKFGVCSSGGLTLGSPPVPSTTFYWVMGVFPMVEILVE